MGNFPENIAKILIFAGAVLIFVGAAFFALAKIGFFRLPGDLEMGGKNWKVYFPITTSILVSMILTLVLWLISYLRK